MSTMEGTFYMEGLRSTYYYLISLDVTGMEAWSPAPPPGKLLEGRCSGHAPCSRLQVSVCPSHADQVTL